MMKHMIVFRDCLSPAEKDALQTLLAACSTADGTQASVPDDADLCCLLQSAEEARPCLFAALFIYHMGDTRDGEAIDELSAFTHPDFRRRGFFSMLLKSAAPLLRPWLRFCIPSGQPADALCRIGALHAYDECLMQLSLPQNAAQTLRLSFSEEPEEPGLFHVSCRYGECSLLLRTDNSLYLYGLLIYARFRAQGFGTRFMKSLLSLLSARGYAFLVLEVSSANRPAYRLYEKLGFAVTERLSCYYLKNRNGSL